MYETRFEWKREWLLTGVGNEFGLIVEPALRLDGLLVDDLVGSVLVPVLGLSSLGIRDLLLVNPVLRLLILGIVDLLVGVDSGSEVLEEVATVVALAVVENVVGVVRADWAPLLEP